LDLEACSIFGGLVIGFSIELHFGLGIQESQWKKAMEESGYDIIFF
jgi:hypothetical protein